MFKHLFITLLEHFIPPLLKSRQLGRILKVLLNIFMGVGVKVSQTFVAAMDVFMGVGVKVSQTFVAAMYHQVHVG